MSIAPSPDIHVGTPLIDIVEKVLETKAKELLPKISEAVDFLCDTKAKQLKEAQAIKEAAPTPVLSPNPTTDVPKSEFDLSLLIDIPGLSTTKSQSSKKEAHGGSGGGKKEGQVKAKPKGTAEASKTGNKSKPTLSGKTSAPGGGKAKSEGKELQKQAAEKEMVSKEKEKPRYRIPKKSKEATNADKQEKEPSQEGSKVEDSQLGTCSSAKDKKSLTEEPQSSFSSTKDKVSSPEEPVKSNANSSSKNKKGSTEEPKPVRRRSARIASQTDSKASSDNEGGVSEPEVEGNSRKRANALSQSGKKRPRLSSSDDLLSEEEVSSGGYESDTDLPGERESLQEIERKLSKKSDAKGSARRKAKRPVHKPRASKSPPVVITRYNRSVKPNRRYVDDSAEVEDTMEEMGGAEPQGEDWTDPRLALLETLQSCDSGETEVRGDALVIKGQGAEPVYEMITPKPPPLKIRKAVVKGLRSRKKTSTRINFFCHR